MFADVTPYLVGPRSSSRDAILPPANHRTQPEGPQPQTGRDSGGGPHFQVSSHPCHAQSCMFQTELCNRRSWPGGLAGGQLDWGGQDRRGGQGGGVALLGNTGHLHLQQALHEVSVCQGEWGATLICFAVFHLAILSGGSQHQLPVSRGGASHYTPQVQTARQVLYLHFLEYYKNFSPFGGLFLAWCEGMQP